MADHQPDLRPNNGQMVCNRLRIGWANTDIDQRDARAIRGAQMVGRHLEPAPGSGIDFGACRFGWLGNFQPARHGKRRIVIILHQLVQRPVTERIDIAVIVRKQHIMLEMLNRRAAIMLQTLQGKIHALGIEQRQRMRLIRLIQFAIGHFVANVSQVRAWEVPGQLCRRDFLQAGGEPLLPDIGVRDFGVGLLDMNLDLIIPHQQGQLLAKIIPEEIRTGDGGDIGAGFGHLAEGARNGRRRTIRIIDETDLRITEGPGLAQRRIRRRAFAQECVQGGGKGRYGLGIERFQRVYDMFRCSEF